jgi:hypothetical protein
MAIRSGILIGLGIAALLFGVAVLVFTTKVLRWVAQDDVHVLTTRYDPNGDPVYQPMRTYENLYEWTERLVHHRNHFAMAFHYTLGASCVVIGLLLIAWTVDRERLRRKAGDGLGP